MHPARLLAAGGSADLCSDEKTSVMTCVLGKRNTGLLVKHAQHGAVVGDKNREQLAGSVALTR
jgi:hypothetical protein